MFSRGFIAMMFFGTLVCAKADEGKPLSEAELAEFLGPNATSLMTWNMAPAVDFVLYYGTAKPPLTGNAGFYLGQHPDFEPDPSSTTVPGRLGIFNVKWRRTVSAEGIHQETLFSLDTLDFEQAHVWVKAGKEANLSQLVADLSRLPMFSHLHWSEMHEEIVGERRQRINARLICGGLILAGAWWLDRRMRRVNRSGVRRGLALGGYAIGWFLVVASLMALPNDGGNLIHAVGIHAARSGFWTIVISASSLLILSSIIVAVSFVRRRLAPALV
jgi:hypothetical protein